MPISGKQKAWGEAVLQGVSLALGDQFKILVKDTRGEPDGAQQAVAALAQELSGTLAMRNLEMVAREHRTRGSRGCPEHIRKRVATELRNKTRVGDSRIGLGNLSAEQLIADPDTAVVLVMGEIGAAALREIGRAHV